MTESAIISSNPYHGDRKYGSVGKAIEGVEVKIVDDFGKALEFDEVGHVQMRTCNHERLLEKTGENKGRVYRR